MENPPRCRQTAHPSAKLDDEDDEPDGPVASEVQAE
jgi:hypothetical protein